MFVVAFISCLVLVFVLVLVLTLVFVLTLVLALVFAIVFASSVGCDVLASRTTLGEGVIDCSLSSFHAFHVCAGIFCRAVTCTCGASVNARLQRGSISVVVVPVSLLLVVVSLLACGDVMTLDFGCVVSAISSSSFSVDA